MHKLGTILFIFALAGCTANSPTDTPKNDPQSAVVLPEPDENRTPPEPPFVISVEPSSLLMTDCDGLYARLVLPSDLIGAEPPETWGPGPTPVTEVWVNVHHCTRLAIDEFERGPVTILVEVHGNRNPPPACQGDYVTSEIITQFWVDDEELAEHFATKYSLPVKHARINLSFDTSESIESYAADFTPDGGVTSVIQEIRPHDPFTASGPLTYRRFWTNQVGGISYMDFTDDASTASTTPPIVSGELQEPFLYSHTGAPAFVGLGGFYQGGSIDAPIKQFRDLACTEPLL